MDTTDKKEEFLSGAQRYRGPNRAVILVFGLVALVGVAWFFLATRENAEIVRRFQGGSYNIGRSMDYRDKVISMTDITSSEVNGKVRLSLDEVVKNSIIYSQVTADNALVALVTPAGRLVVAYAMCEPCRSLRFRIEGYNLVCETCGTRWNLNDFNGISGGCLPYPPEELPYEVQDGMILVPADVVKNWKPRI